MAGVAGDADSSESFMFDLHRFRRYHHAYRLVGAGSLSRISRPRLDGTPQVYQKSARMLRAGKAFCQFHRPEMTEGLR
jgi:hypothetical protein